MGNDFCFVFVLSLFRPQHIRISVSIFLLKMFLSLLLLSAGQKAVGPMVAASVGLKGVLNLSQCRANIRMIPRYLLASQDPVLKTIQHWQINVKFPTSGGSNQVPEC